MEPLAYVIMTYPYGLPRNAFSALPDAPVVEDVRRPRGLFSTRRTRATLAVVLRRAADEIAPTPSTPACATG